MPTKFEQHDFSLANNIANASHEDLIELAHYLNDVKQFNSALFQEKFQNKFPGIQSHTIECLGGLHANHYLLTNPITLEKQVLKIAPNIGVSGGQHNPAVNEHLVHVFASRREAPISIELTEFCANGTLLECGKSISDAREKTTNVLNNHEQVVEILQTLGAHDTLLPDMKPTHLLVTEQGKVVIANTASLMQTSHGQFNHAMLEQNPSYSPGPGFSPPTGNNPDSSADKHHAYLLGVSLYLCLTDQTMDVIHKNPDKLSFEHPVFKTEQGSQLQQLIEGLLKKQPDERLSLEDAKRQLAIIKPQYSDAKSTEVKQSNAATLMEQYKSAIHRDRQRTQPTDTMQPAQDSVLPTEKGPSPF